MSAASNFKFHSHRDCYMKKKETSQGERLQRYLRSEEMSFKTFWAKSLKPATQSIVYNHKWTVKNILLKSNKSIKVQVSEWMTKKSVFLFTLSGHTHLLLHKGEQKLKETFPNLRSVCASFIRLFQSIMINFDPFHSELDWLDNTQLTPFNPKQMCWRCGCHGRATTD